MPRKPDSKFEIYMDAVLGVPMTVMGVAMMTSRETWRQILDPRMWMDFYFLGGMAMAVAMLLGGLSMIWSTLKKLGIVKGSE